MIRFFIACSGIGLLASSVLASPAPWNEILNSAKGEIPPATTSHVTWRTNLYDAIAEARRHNRPLFVTFRCLPCKQCADFDKEVLEGGPELDPLLTRFVTVRLTDAMQIDLRIFPVEGFQDLDLSWWGWFLSPEAQVYGIFGGKDHISDSTRISKQALINSLWRVLKHHYDPRRKLWNIDGPVPNLTGTVLGPSDLPGWKSWLSKRTNNEHLACLHCHHVNDVLRQPALDAGRFDKKRDVEVWPFPENVGITLDRDDGLRVVKVEPGSAADRTGIQPGDSLGAAAGRRLFGQADFRGVLHRGPRGAGTINVVWLRDQQVFQGQLAVTDGWRKTVLDWRMSISQGNIGAYPGFFPLAIRAEKRKQLEIPENAMAVEPYMGQNTTSAAYRAGIRQQHVVTAINGQQPNLSGRAFLVWFRQQFDPGDEVTVTLRDQTGQRRVITYRLSPADH